MLIDFHTHCFPDFLAPKAIPPMEKTAEQKAETDGTFSGLLKKQKDSGVDRFVVMHIATRKGSMRKTNDFAISIQSENVYSYGSVFPDDEGVMSELEYISDNMYGLKLHPDYQNFFAIEEKYFPIYEKCEELNLPVLFHPGFDPVSPEVNHCPVDAVRVIAKTFPSLKIVAAHMGAMARSDEVLEKLTGIENIYFDISMSKRYTPFEKYERIIKEHGCDKILFATDSPWSTVEREMGMLERVALSEEEMALVTHKNALYLLGRKW